MNSLKVGIIGSGQWGGHHATVFNRLPHAEVVAVCDIDPARADAFGKSAGVEAVYTDHKALLDDPNVDAVSIATPDFAHTEIILDAISAGKHILTEKPLATTLDEALKVQRAAKGYDKVFMVDFHNRVSPVFAGLREDIQGGEIGAVVHAAARLSNTRFVPLEMLSWAAQSSALWFLGSHAIDALRFVLEDEVTRVYSVARKGVLKEQGVDTEDVHLSTLEFSKGTVVTLENSWIHSNDNPQVFDFRMDFVGSQGQLQVNSSHNLAYQKMGGSGISYRELFGFLPTGEGRVAGFIQESIARFADAVVHGSPIVAGVDDGVNVTRVLHAIGDSVRSGQPVDIEYGDGGQS